MGVIKAKAPGPRRHGRGRRTHQGAPVLQLVLDYGRMAGRIPQAFIDELIARADIVELIGARVPLKKAGREYKACCPFHDEKTPSFWVSPDKQFYHCFGCGAHGTALGFLMDYDRLPFPEAVEELAGRAGPRRCRTRAARGAAQRRQRRRCSRRHRLYELLGHSRRALLRQPDASARARDYATRRGLTRETSSASASATRPIPGTSCCAGSAAASGLQRSAGRGLIIERDASRQRRWASASTTIASAIG